MVRGELTVPEEALKVPHTLQTHTHTSSHTQHSAESFLLCVQHEKFTSGLQLSKKLTNGEATTSTTRSPTKTFKRPTPQPPGDGSPRPAEGRSADGIPVFKETDVRPLDPHRVEDKIGESQGGHTGNAVHCHLEQQLS